MPAPSSGGRERFDQTVLIAAPPAVVFDCFFSPDALQIWWRVVRSVTTAVPFGVYAVEWTPTPYRDEVLGPLGGVFHGTVVDAQTGRQFLVGLAEGLRRDGPRGLRRRARALTTETIELNGSGRNAAGPDACRQEDE